MQAVRFSQTLLALIPAIGSDLGAGAGERSRLGRGELIFHFLSHITHPISA